MTRGDTGRASVGPRARRLDRGEVLARRDAALRQPASPERTRALTTIRRQLQSIERRVI